MPQYHLSSLSLVTSVLTVNDKGSAMRDLYLQWVLPHAEPAASDQLLAAETPAGC